MKFAQVTVAVVALFGYAIAVGYESGSRYSSYGGDAGGPNSRFQSGTEDESNIGGASSGRASKFRGAVEGASYGGGSASTRFRGGAGESGRNVLGSAQSGAEAVPQPYQFFYNAVDEPHNLHFRYEKGDVNGAVRGSYGYNNEHGLYRTVYYEADENGFRATIDTNEPGTDGKKSPADVVVRPHPGGFYYCKMSPKLSEEDGKTGVSIQMACRGGGASSAAGISDRDFVVQQASPQSYSGASGGDAAPRSGLCHC